MVSATQRSAEREPSPMSDFGSLISAARFVSSGVVGDVDQDRASELIAMRGQPFEMASCAAGERRPVVTSLASVALRQITPFDAPRDNAKALPQPCSNGRPSTHQAHRRTPDQIQLLRFQVGDPVHGVRATIVRNPAPQNRSAGLRSGLKTAQPVEWQSLPENHRSGIARPAWEPKSVRGNRDSSGPSKAKGGGATTPIW
jgi:hypothetical protein